MMADEKSNPPPPYIPGVVTEYEGQQPAYPSSAVPPPPSYPGHQQQTSANVAFFGGTPVTQNVLVIQTVRANAQVPDVYPGFAFCKFTPGIIETLIRTSLAVRIYIGRFAGRGRN